MGPTPTPTRLPRNFVNVYSTRRLTREDLRAKVGEDVRVGPMEMNLSYIEFLLV